MKRKLFLTGLFCLVMLFANAQQYDFPSPVSFSPGLSGASDTTVWSLFSNPSGICDVGHIAAGCGYHNSFLIEALSSQTVFVVVPLSLFHGGIAYSRFGNELFNQQHFSVSMARDIAPCLKMGVRFRYLIRTIQNTEGAEVFTVDAGFSFDVSDDAVLSVYSRNPAGQSLKDDFSEQPLPSFLALACNVKLSPVFNITADLSHRNDLSRQLYGFMMSARVHSLVELRSSVSAKPVRLGFGASVWWEGFELTLAASHHDRLGLSSTAGIVWHLPAKRGGGK